MVKQMQDRGKRIDILECSSPPDALALHRCSPENPPPKAAEFYGVTRTSGVGSITYTNWEADMVMTCICDWGYTGGDCSLRMCPKGDDPVTTLQDSPSVRMTTTATVGGRMEGTFLLSFQVRKMFPPSF